jgi:META domain
MIMRFCRALLVLLLLAVSPSLAAASDPFPFGATLMLDATPMRGSKRVPMLEIAEDGATSIDLWCATVRAEAAVGDNSITIVLRDQRTSQCEPERQALDADLLTTLLGVTNWRREGEVVELLGAAPLRFRLMTN